MAERNLFHIINQIDSTNNYAMQQVHAGLAVHGESWLALEQFAGKGQRGRSWVSSPGESLALSIALKPHSRLTATPFLFSAALALAVREWALQIIPGNFSLKWPNDLYYNDKKAGGILIENQYRGDQWIWSVAGIGINLNQPVFPEDLPNPVSFRQITGEQYDPETAGLRLRDLILKRMENPDPEAIYRDYLAALYGKNARHRFKKENRIFEAKVVGVSRRGDLLTESPMPEAFQVGDVQWLIS